MCKSQNRNMTARAVALIALMALTSREEAVAHQDPPGCSGSGVNMILQARRDLAPVDGVGDTPISAGSTLLDGETIYYRAIMRFSGDPACAYESGTVCIDLPRPGVGSCLDVTPVGGFPQIGGTLGVAEVATRETNYLVSVNDVQLVGQLCQGQLRAEARYRNGFFHGETHVSPIDADTPLCNPVVKPCVEITKRCLSATLNAAGQVVVCFSGSISNCGSVALTNISVVNSKPVPNTPVTGIPSSLAIGATANFNGCYTNLGDICGPFPDTVTVTAEAQGFPVALFPTSRVTDSATDQCTITYQPSIQVTKECPPAPVQPGGTLNWTGTVTNTGNVPLTNVVVRNDKPAPNTIVFGPMVLAPGAGAAFGGSYVVPADSCGPYTDTLTATGFDICSGNGVTNSDNAICPGTNNPSIVVTKECPPAPVQPGGTLNWTGTVTNTGNITLTNVIVRNDKPAPNTIVFGPTNLAPGAGAAFSGSYVVPLDSCGPYTDTLTAAGADKCFGRIVTDTDDAVCPGTNNPSIVVTKDCPPAPVQPGGTLNWTGTVTNTGNITLTNVIVRNDKPAPNTIVFGPMNLAPGAGAAFGGSYVVPLDSCGPYTDTLTASGADKCFGRIVTDTDDAVCPGTNNPAIVVIKNCPPSPVPPGGTLNWTGTVTNTGNITLTNVIVRNDKPAPNTIVFGPTNLAPGAGAAFGGSYVVPLDSCGPYTDTLTASGADKCFGRIVTDTDDAVCPGTSNPGLVVTKECPPAPVQPGGTLNWTGTVTNTGNITLTNVIVRNDKPAPNTIVFGPMNLLPGAGAAFGGSYVVPLDSCGPYTDTLVATGVDICSGRSITNSDVAICPGTNNPSIVVTKDCPPAPVQPGGTLNWTGTVTNTGNITLTNVIVRNDKPAPNTIVFGPINLAPGAGAAFGGSYVVPLDSCGPYTDTLTASGADKCFGRIVTDTDDAVCPGTNNPSIVVTKSCPPNPTPVGGNITITGTVTNTGNITLTNVTVTNFVAAIGRIVRVFGPMDLAPGAGGTFSDTYNVGTNCPSITDRVQARGADKCFGRIVTDEESRTCPVTCFPKICIIKEVACLYPNDNCGPFSKEAIGIRSETQDPAFCYRITVTNCGEEKLVGVTVIDNQLGDLTTNFFGVGVTSGMLDLNESITRFFKMDWDEDTTNRVEALGVGDQSRIRTNALDLAIARVKEARIACRTITLIDGVPSGSCPELPNDGAPHVVTFRIEVCNTGQADLSDVTIVNPILQGMGCTPPAPFSLAIGRCATNDFCSLTLTCPGITNFSHNYMVKANVDVNSTNNGCAYDINGTNIMVRTECEGCISCTPPGACRVTGGGRQDDPIVCPDGDVRYVTHGGQVGAPVGERVCAIDTTLPNWQLGNPCIHGRWTHVRHMKGGLRGNFHARFFDTLDCACLDTNLTGCQYGAGTKVGELCGDRSTGPLPRPAPANKITFTGVGDWTCDPGRRRPRACLFRVDIEDRGEPGNAHALDANGKPNRVPDRYRIRIWVLTEAEEAALRNPADGLLAFRNCISSCNGIDYRDGGAVSSNGASCEQNNCNGNICPGEDTSSTGTITFPGGCPVRTPNIDDGGELLHGNHQIHPAIKHCDPHNPTGPGLPKP